MVEKPHEWRRFERVELSSGTPRFGSPRTTARATGSTTPSLLQEFERVLRENERLRMELASFRESPEKNDIGTLKFREELRSAQAELARIDESVAPHHSDRPVNQGPTETSAAEHAQRDEEEFKQIAAVVAGYIFAQPQEANIRLVEDALRARCSHLAVIREERRR